MLEIEQKYSHADLDQLEQTLLSLGATAREVVQEADHYLRAPDRDFARTDEAFRLRRIGSRNYLTYKGPKQGGPVKKRTELEIALPEGEEAAINFLQLFHHLGYRPSLIVRKRRRLLDWAIGQVPLVVCLDEVADLGHFVEVEVVVEPGQESVAESAIQQASRLFGLHQVEQRSYLQMLLETVGKGQS